MRSVGWLALGSMGLALCVILFALAWSGLDERSTPIAVTLAGTVMTVCTGLVAAARAESARQHAVEASEAANGARAIARVTISKTAALEQTVTAHCGQICPAIYCPLRRPEEQT